MRGCVGWAGGSKIVLLFSNFYIYLLNFNCCNRFWANCNAFYRPFIKYKSYLYLKKIINIFFIFLKILFPFNYPLYFLTGVVQILL